MREIPKKSLEQIRRNRGKSVRVLAKETGLSKEDVRAALLTLSTTPAYSSVVPSKVLIIIALSSVISVAISYANAMTASFHLDDAHVIRENPAITSIGNIPSFFTDNTTVAAGGEFYRPLLFVTYAFDFALGGLHTFFYHLTSVLLHAFTAFFAGLLVYLAISLAGKKRGIEYGWEKTLASAFAAILFAGHPMLTEAVTYVSGRSEVLVSLFILAALFFAVSADLSKKGIFTALSVLCFAASLFSKEYAFIMPALFLLFFAFFLKGDFEFSKTRFIALVAVLAIWAIILLHFRSQARVMTLDITAMEYAFSQPLVILTYIARLLFPSSRYLTFDYNAQEFLKAEAWKQGAALLFLAAVISSAIMFRRKAPLAAFGGLFFFIAILPTSSVFPIKDVIFERRAYLAAVGFVFVLAEAVLAIAPVLKKRGKAKYAAAVVLGILPCSYMAGSHFRNRAYRTAETLLQDTIAKNSANSRSFINMGIIHLTRAEQRKMEKKDAEAAEYQKQALTYFLAATEKKDADELAFNAAGAAFFALDDLSNAEKYFQRSLEIFPNTDVRTEATGAKRTVKLYDEPHFWLGRIHMREAAKYSPDAAKMENALRMAAQEFDDVLWIYDDPQHVSVDKATSRTYVETHLLLADVLVPLAKIYSTNPGSKAVGNQTSSRAAAVLEKALLLPLEPDYKDEIRKKIEGIRNGLRKGS